MLSRPGGPAATKEPLVLHSETLSKVRWGAQLFGFQPLVILGNSRLVVTASADGFHWPVCSA